jgi:hypothetical protein
MSRPNVSVAIAFGALGALGACSRAERSAPPSSSAVPSATALAPVAAPEAPGAGGSEHMSLDAGVALVGKDEGLGSVQPIGPSPYDASMGHGLHGAKIREGALTVSGRLAPEIVQRTARRHFDAFRACYEVALRDDPTLSGRVAIKIVIDASGKVSSSADAGSEIAAPEVARCVATRFAEIIFPAPEGGVVTAVYRLVFEPPG